MSTDKSFSNLNRQELETCLNLNTNIYLKWKNDSSWKIIYVTENITSLLGYTHDEALLKKYIDLIHPEDLDVFLDEHKNRTKNSPLEHKPYRLQKSDSSYLWVKETSAWIDEGSFLVAITDISSLINSSEDLSKTTAFLESYKLALDESSIVSKSDIYGNITYGNKNFQKITGYTNSELLGKPHNINRHPDTPKKIFKDMWNTIKNRKIWKGILKNRKKDGSAYWVDMTILPILDENDNIIEYIGVRHEITTIIEQRQTIATQAFINSLTKLPNRQKLLKDLNEKPITGLAFLDVDKFSQVNDLYGYANGDNIIIKLADEVCSYLKKRSNTSLYHLSADEFILTTTSKNKKEFLDLMKSILKQISHLEVNFDDIHIILDLNCGISFEPSHKLLQTATMAMKHSRTVKEDIIIYNEELNRYKEYEANIFWNSKLHKALLGDKIVPYFQPIVNNKNGKWEKYEALVRLIEDDTVHSPFHFLEIAKQTKQYKSITRAVVEKSLSVFKENNLTLSINLSKDDIFDPSTRSFLIDSIEKSGIGNRLVFEIVESEGIDNFQKIDSFINEVRELGCQIAIDDFGTGYSNFAYILQLKPDFIKIDGSMIRNLTTNKNNCIIVQTIVKFAKSIGIQTVAEFVKDEATFKAVKELGIDYSQGYFFSEPLPKLIHKKY